MKAAGTTIKDKLETASLEAGLEVPGKFKVRVKVRVLMLIVTFVEISFLLPPSITYVYFFDFSSDHQVLVPPLMAIVIYHDTFDLCCSLMYISADTLIAPIHCWQLPTQSLSELAQIV